MSLNLFYIPADVAFLPALTRAVLSGSVPGALAPPALADLPHWTILLPTRRAVRSLQRSFLKVAGRGAMLLPRIRPIGDVEEDVLAPELSEDSADDDLVAPAIPAIEREALLIRLIDEWAGAHPDERLAREIAGSPSQAIGLARSLAALIDTFETEDVDLDRLPDLFESDLAQHRNSILSFLAIIREKLPEELARLRLMGPMARRSQLLRREARRLTETHPPFPIIAAGSTGSVPAAADLLRAIASLANGTVVLPGLDLRMSEESWREIGPQHPQFGLKRLLDSWSIRRRDVDLLPGIEQAARNPGREWLSSEIMRPTGSAATWRPALIAGRKQIAQGMAGVSLVEARDHHEEAEVISLMMREVLETPGKTASLVTPDRDLARRVVSTLRRWGVAIDDSAGEPLIARPLGSLVAALIDYCLSGFAIHEFAKLLHHPLALFGEEAAIARRASGIMDLALLRAGRDRLEPDAIGAALGRAQGDATADVHAHPAVKRLSAEDWALACEYALKIEVALKLLIEFDADDGTPAHYIGQVAACLETMAIDNTDQPAAEALDQLMQSITASEHLLPRCGRERCLLLLAGWLRRVPVRLPNSHPRLAILGLLEARLVNADLVIMGGLTEGTWPAQPDPGPWINRPMREALGLTAPERSIGLTAHDFVQALGAPEVVLTRSRRVKEQPAVASRWILRLEMILQIGGMAHGTNARWLAWARSLDEAQGDRRVAMPRPKPPLAARPRSLSVTQVEKLMRDPYGIYSEKVLRLLPLPPIGALPDAGLRGSLIHAALNEFAAVHPTQLPEDAEAALLRIGRDVFSPYFADADVAGFWWPRFERIVPWYIAEERRLRRGLLRIHAEVKGVHRFDAFMLTGRADRLDIMASGKARLIDYKTGRIPSSAQVKSGLAPQLTLEAALLAQGEFEGVAAIEADELLYIKLSGGVPPGMLVPVTEIDVMAKAQEHLAQFESLMRAYDDETKGYIPRAAMEKEQDTSPFDHLSRWQEWSLAEEAP